MGEYFRTVYIVRWECGIANYQSTAGTYTKQDEALSVAKVLQEKNPDGLAYVETVIVPAR